DIIENKKTILYIAAINQSNIQQKERLLNLYSEGQGEIDNPSKIQSVISLFDELNVRQSAENLKNECLNRAYEDLNRLNVDPKRLIDLKNLAQTLINRIH